MLDEDFDDMPISNEYWIDKRRSYKGKLMNSDFLFELFGVFSSKDGWTVRKEMLERVKLECDLYSTVGKTVLNMRECNIDEWLSELEDPDNSPDELMLYCLSCTYNRHTVVLCKDRFWNTLHLEEPITEGTLFSNCHVHLVYLGSGIFGQLWRKPYSQNLQNPLVEEHELMALMSKQGVGRLRKNPLNLSSNGKLKDVHHELKTISSVRGKLDSGDCAYLHEVINQVVGDGMQSQKTGVANQSGNIDSLFTMFITPQDTEINNGMNIEGEKNSEHLEQNNATAIVITIPAPVSTTPNQSVAAEKHERA